MLLVASSSVWGHFPGAPSCQRAWPPTCASKVRQGCFQESSFSCAPSCLAAWGREMLCGCGNSLISDQIQYIDCISQVREASRLQNWQPWVQRASLSLSFLSCKPGLGTSTIVAIGRLRSMYIMCLPRAQAIQQRTGLLSPRRQERIFQQLWPWVLSSIVLVPRLSQNLKKCARSMLVE